MTPAPRLDGLSPEQRQLVHRWLPGAVVEKDLSWGLVETTVLQVSHGGSRWVVKAGGAHDTHLAREIHAYLHWLDPWTGRGRAPVLGHFDAQARILVISHLPGRLVLGTAHAGDPGTFRQAGGLLADLHAQTTVTDPDYESRENRKAITWLDGDHRIAPEVEERLRDEIASWPAPAAHLVPTHGDWQPRNWLVHEGVVAVIDLGRAALRPAMSDLARLAAQEFRGSRALERAFLEGYGSDPREPEAWHRIRVREAIGTSAWAHIVRDEAFEAQGHRMIADVLGPRTGPA